MVDIGITHEWFACNVVYEIIDQVYNTEQFCVLSLVDEYNYFYNWTAYNSYRYATDTQLSGTIPPHHLSLCRAFLNFDGHKIKNGIKIVGSSLKSFHKHKFNGEKIFFPKGYEYEMKGIPLNDFRTVSRYYY